MNKFAKGIVKFKWLIMAIVIALSVFLGHQIKDLIIDSDIISSLPDDNGVRRWNFYLNHDHFT